MLAHIVVIAMALPAASAFFGGCCCGCGLPMPASCGCPQTCQACPQQSCPVCEVCPPPVHCPPPPVAVCPAPQPVYVQPACAGGGCGVGYSSGGGGGYALPQGGGYSLPSGGGYSLPTGGGYSLPSGPGFIPAGGTRYSLPGGTLLGPSVAPGVGELPTPGLSNTISGPLPGGGSQCTIEECRQRYFTQSGESERYSTSGSAAIPPAGDLGGSYEGPPLPSGEGPEEQYEQGAPPPNEQGQFADAAEYSQKDSASVDAAVQEDEEGEALSASDASYKRGDAENMRKARGVTTAKDPKCNNEKLKKLILKNIVAGNPVASKRAIHKAAVRDVKDEVIDIICSDAGFTYIVSTAEHCEAQRDKVICFAYIKP